MESLFFFELARYFFLFNTGKKLTKINILLSFHKDLCKICYHKIFNLIVFLF